MWTFRTHSAWYRLPLGVAIGLIAAAAVLSFFDGTGGAMPGSDRSGELLSDCDGTIRELAIQYTVEAAPIVATVYADFLGQLPADVTVHVICPGRADFDDLTARLGPTACKLSPVIVDHPITCWSRDRWLALRPVDNTERTVLLHPRAEMAAEIWPQRQGDQRVAINLAAALGTDVGSRRSELYFDGGDFVADDQTVFVTPAVLLRNFQQTVHTRDELLETLADTLGRKIVLLDEAPDHHAGMFMMPVGNRTVLVGDPAAAEKILAGAKEIDASKLCPPEGPDFSAATIARFDAVARQCEAAGYRVRRIPVVPGANRRTYVTYLNVILDQRDGRRIVYLPVYTGAEPLNRSAIAIWEELGYEVRPVDCTDCHIHFGSLRCLVNVVDRG